MYSLEILVKSLRIIVISTASTGKSYLIKAIRRHLCKMAGIKSKIPVLVIALTGVVTFNINRSMIYLMLSIPILNNKSININSDKMKQLQKRLKNVTYFIIDEKNMVG
jgi:DNA replication protein DnaC